MERNFERERKLKLRIIRKRQKRNATENKRVKSYTRRMKYATQ